MPSTPKQQGPTYRARGLAEIAELSRTIYLGMGPIPFDDVVNRVEERSAETGENFGPRARQGIETAFDLASQLGIADVDFRRRECTLKPSGKADYSRLKDMIVYSDEASSDRNERRMILDKEIKGAFGPVNSRTRREILISEERLRKLGLDGNRNRLPPVEASVDPFIVKAPELPNNEAPRDTLQRTPTQVVIHNNADAYPTPLSRANSFVPASPTPPARLYRDAAVSRISLESSTSGPSKEEMKQEIALLRQQIEVLKARIAQEAEDRWALEEDRLALEEALVEAQAKLVRLYRVYESFGDTLFDTDTA